MKPQVVAVVLGLVSLLSCSRAEHPGAPPSPPPRPEELVWSGLKECYVAGTQIRAEVVNRSAKPVYFAWFWPEPSGQFHRLEESTRQWVAGDHGIACGTVDDRNTPRMLPAGGRLAFGVYDCFSSRDGSIQFRPEGGGALTYPAEGTYKVTLRYAREPWTAGNTPEQVLKTESPPFRISPHC